MVSIISKGIVAFQIAGLLLFSASIVNAMTLQDIGKLVSNDKKLNGSIQRINFSTVNKNAKVLQSAMKELLREGQEKEIGLKDPNRQKGKRAILTIIGELDRSGFSSAVDKLSPQILSNFSFFKSSEFKKIESQLLRDYGFTKQDIEKLCVQADKYKMRYVSREADDPGHWQDPAGASTWEGQEDEGGLQHTDPWTAFGAGGAGGAAIVGDVVKMFDWDNLDNEERAVSVLSCVAGLIAIFIGLF